MLRAKIREDVNLEREKLRNSFADSCRVGLGEIQKNYNNVLISNPQEVEKLALKLKQKGKASEEDMRKLSYAFIQSVDNIKAFMNVPLALSPLINELAHGNRTIAALECFYNLSLGDKKICDMLIKATGFYIVTFAHQGDDDIKRLSLWILANLLAEGSQNIKCLLDANLLEVLWKYYNPIETTEDFCMDSAICLYLAVKNSKSEQFRFIQSNFTKKSPTSVGAEYHLCFLYHANLLKCDLEENEKVYMLNFALFNLRNIEIETFAGKLKVLYAVRIFANMLYLYKDQVNFLESILRVMSLMDMDITHILNKLFNCRDQILTEETCWLMKHWTELLIANKQPIDNFLETLKICK